MYFLICTSNKTNKKKENFKKNYTMKISLLCHNGFPFKLYFSFFFIYVLEMLSSKKQEVKSNLIINK